jgi:hypothetical protein
MHFERRENIIFPPIITNINRWKDKPTSISFKYEYKLNNYIYLFAMAQNMTCNSLLDILVATSNNRHSKSRYIKKYFLVTIRISLD